MSVDDILEKKYYDVEFLVTPYHKVNIRFFTNKEDAFCYYNNQKITEHTWNFLERDITLYWSNETELSLPQYDFIFDYYYGTETLFKTIGLNVYRGRSIKGWEGDTYNYSIQQGCCGCDVVMPYKMKDVFSIIKTKIQNNEGIDVKLLNILISSVYMWHDGVTKSFIAFKRSLPYSGIATDKQILEFMHFIPIIIKYGRFIDNR